MHENCYRLFKKMAESLEPGQNVLDVGSFDVNGCLKPLFKAHQYTGCDLTAGPNVDVVQSHPDMLPVASEAYDLVVSANCLEHCKRPWQLVLEMDRVVKPGGLVEITVPWGIGYHPYPVDCYRLTPDAFTELFTAWMTDNFRRPYAILENCFADAPRGGLGDVLFRGRKL